MTVVLADRTAPILFEVWREQAERLHHQFLDWGVAAEDPEEVIVEVQRFDAREENRPHRTSMRKLRCNEHTTVTRRQEATRDSMRLGSVVPHPGLFAKDFNRLAAPPPFHISVAGIVSSVTPMTESNNGVDM